ncbi:MAG: (2Fe-2S) ferredoxin domain-containing protein [Anaerolineae bacterium]|nr:(2Fe-2S) ferredoxin domain-containing protein [Anaerolineae bacterium]
MPDSHQPPRVIVCTGVNCNAAGCGERIYHHLEALLAQADPLHPPFLLRTANCLDMCAVGPNMVIYPGNRRFNSLDEATAEVIVRRESAPDAAGTES